MSFFSWLKALNRRRLFMKRLRVLRREDLPERRFLARPSAVMRVLVIDASPGFGDALYANGLVRALVGRGLRVSIAVQTKTLSVFRTNPCIEQLYALESESDRNDCLAQQFDMVLDLDYNHTHTFSLRMPWLKGLRCYALTCSEYGRELNVFHEFVDISRFAHVGERLGLALSAVVSESRVVPVMPHLDVLADARGCVPGIYVNTVASQEDRCLTAHQVLVLAEWFRTTRRIPGYFYIDDAVPLQEDEWVRRVRPKSFLEAAAFVKGMHGVVTPDTSIVHVASAFDLPTLAFFCGKERDYHAEYSMAATWAPKARYHKTLLPDERRSGKVIAISEIDDDSLIKGMDWLLRILSQEHAL